MLINDGVQAEVITQTQTNPIVSCFGVTAWHLKFNIFHSRLERRGRKACLLIQQRNQFNLGDLTKTIFCLKTGQAVKRSSGQSALTCFNSSFQTRSVVTKNAETDAYYQKMVLTYNITFFLGIAVFLVLGFLINVTLLSIFIKMLPRPCC